MSNLTLRSLYPEDIDQVASIESSLTGSPRRDLLEKRLVVATANLSAPFQDELAVASSEPQSMPENFITCGALDGKKLAGYGFARILEGEFGARKPVVELDDIGVDPGYQGKGIGKLVVSGIEQRMAKRNISTLRTQIAWSNLPMVSFFASAGFTLASGQIIERGTSPLGGDTAAAAALGQCESGCNCQDKPAGVTVRPLKWDDLAAVDRIDAKLTGLDRSAYCAAKFREVLDESGARVSLVAEVDGIVAGFIMVRADFGEFGGGDTTSVIDTIGVHPSYRGRGIGYALLSQLLVKLDDLKVQSVRTKVDQDNFGLWSFLTKCDFKPSQRLLLTKEIR